jgi:hypothetical protein
MRESLLFPYNQGARFQDAVYRKMGRDAFEAVFAQAPNSTQQILHPADYFDKTVPVTVEPLGIDQIVGKQQAGQFRGIMEGAVGEFDHAVLLRQYVGEHDGTEAARHWRGGAFRLYENKKDGYPVLSYVSQWDSPESARAYFALYQRVLKGKWKKMEVTSATPTEVSGAGDSGRFTVRISGTSVQSVEGLR